MLDADGPKIGEKAIDLPEANLARILNFDGPNAKIAEWSAAELKGFLEVINTAVGHVANQSRTPAYYLMTGGTFSNIGGDGITALDAGLVQKVLNLNDTMSDPMREVARLICLVLDDKQKAAAMAAGKTEWADVEIRSDAQLADSLTKYSSIGFPFAWLAKQKIDDPDELAWVIDKWENERNDPYLAALAAKDKAAANVDAKPAVVSD